MRQILIIAAEEWRLWGRSKLALLVLTAGLVLTIASAAMTYSRITDEIHLRAHLQDQAEETFRSQPARHPHRMVHYGHYVFRTPAPLSVVDPGVDAYTGNVVFLEGHRQNTAMFAEQTSGARLVRFGAFTPAFTLQVFAPLLLILLGYGAVARERESRTLQQLIAQGVSPTALLAGKGLALFGAAGLILAPLFIGALWSGEGLVAVAGFLFGYGVYLLVWCGIVLAISSRSQTGQGAFGALICIWIIAAVLTPRIAASAAHAIVESPGKIATDFALLEELRALGDGHNDADPAFSKLQQELLEQYGVDRVEDLPVNIRGVVATAAERDLTELLNRYAETRMQSELDQARVARAFGWMSPVVAIRDFSMAMAGTDLETHHRFLREAEEVRYDFVQALNNAHAERLAYEDDVNRYADAEAERRARISPENWAVLKDFHFRPASAAERLSASIRPLMQLLAWLIGLLFLAMLTKRRLVK